MFQKSLLSFLIFFSTFVHLSAQKENSFANALNNPFSLHINVASEYGNFFLKERSFGGLSSKEAETFTPKSGIAFYAMLGYQLNETVSLLAGFSYAVKSYHYEITAPLFGTDIMNNTLSYMKFDVTYTNIDLLLLAQLNIKTINKHHFYSNFGLSASRLFTPQQKGLFSESGAPERNLDLPNSFRKANYFAIIAFDYKYQFFRNLSFSVQPIFKLGLIKENFYLRSHEARPYIWGISLGITFKLP